MIFGASKLEIESIMDSTVQSKIHELNRKKIKGKKLPARISPIQVDLLLMAFLSSRPIAIEKI